MLYFYLYWWGASTAKYIEKVLQYAKIINVLVKRPKVIAKYCLNWIYFFHGALYCCVRYSHIEYQDEIFKTYHKKYYSKGNR